MNESVAESSHPGAGRSLGRPNACVRPLAPVPQRARGEHLPEFFIIGAPKCGTSALHRYLREHPGVFMPELKEPQYYCEDFPGISQVSGREAYRALFARAPDGTLLGEASVWYLYSKVAVARILDAAPDARFIVMLRNPVDLARSLHAQFLLTLQEDVDDFETAWDKQAERLQGRGLPSYCPEPSLLQYQKACSLGEQLSRLFEIVDRSRVKVLFFDDFTSDTQGAYDSVLSFLGLDSDNRSEFAKVNARSAYAYPGIIAFLRNPPGLVRPGIFLGKRVLNHFGIRPIRYLRRYLTRPVSSAPLDPALRARLARAFLGDIELLETLLSVSLDHWKR